MSTGTSSTAPYQPNLEQYTAFKKVVSVIGIQVETKSLQNFVGIMKSGNLLFNRRNMSFVRNCNDPSIKAYKIVLVDPGSVGVEPESELSFEMLKLPPGISAMKDKCGAISWVDVELNRNNFTSEEILRDLLPAGVGVPSGFETIGHIAHLNLLDEQLPYKQLIGAVILDKFKSTLRCVVNKTSTIDKENVFRVCPIEVIAGEKETITTVKEHGCIFKLDFEKVYWNSRLQTEHDRLVQLFSKNDVICDMFAGIGPFAVPAAKNVGCRVYANDLNPDSVKWLRVNIEKNKVSELVIASELDARDFVRGLCSAPEPVLFNRIVMNLPATSVEFLDVFREISLENLRLGHRGILWRGGSEIQQPTVHLYCFSNAEDVVADARERIESVLGVRLPGKDGFSVHIVRDVAPNKLMLCCTFVLPEFELDGEDGEEPSARKKARVDTL